MDRANLVNKDATISPGILSPDHIQILEKHLQNNDFIGHQIIKILDYSPFLREIIRKFPDFFKDVLDKGAENTTEALLKTLKQQDVFDLKFEELQALLRIARQKISLSIAFGDIVDQWSVQKVTTYLSFFADIVLYKATNYLLYQFHIARRIILPHPGDPAHESGLIVLAAGKLGAEELNYSSDVDLLFFYDEQKILVSDHYALKKTLNDFVHQFVKLIQDSTEDGYVFRVDLRLRPDSGATPVIMSIGSAMHYYTTVGQNWERAVMIRARQVAGDPVSGAAFFDYLKSYIWRKNLDFETIKDIQSVKRQIQSQRVIVKDDLFDYHLKLGHGGIREIEFFIQTQQLIYGGRNLSLQTRSTLKGLEKLARHGLITTTACDQLSEAYIFYRFLEHRLQMKEDQQTHSLPKTTQEMEAFGDFCGFENADLLIEKLKTHISIVQKNYAELFADAPLLSASGNLVFTGIEDDPDTIESLKKMGFTAPSDISNTIRGWHHGRYRCLKNLSARQYLTELVPVILEELSKTAHPQNAFIQFDRFISLIPYGFQLFSLLYHNPEILTSLARLLGAGPDLSEWLGHNPNLLENLLNPHFLKLLKIDQRKLTENLSLATDYEEALLLCRRWLKNHKFYAGVHSLFFYSSLQEIHKFLTKTTDLLLKTIVHMVQKDFEDKYGQIPQTSFAILALGNYGARQMAANSDLDLIMIFDSPSVDLKSNGKTKLYVQEYYTKLTQRLLNALMAQSNEGRLYEIDMRLRPHGLQGSIAISFEFFKSYYMEKAWIPEIMSLTRSRVVFSTHSLGEKISNQVTEILSLCRLPSVLIKEITGMNEKIHQEHLVSSAFDLKYSRGGIVDIEFLCQYLILRYSHEQPNILRSSTFDALLALKDQGIIPGTHYEALYQAYYLMQGLKNYFAYTLGDTDKMISSELYERVASNYFFDSIKSKGMEFHQSFSSETAEEALMMLYKTTLDIINYYYSNPST